MQNSNPAETQPTSLKPEAAPDSETKPISLDRQTASADPISAPVAQAVDPFAQTIPALVSPPVIPLPVAAADPVAQPVSASAAIPPDTEKPVSRKKGRFGWLLWGFFALLILLGVASISAYGGWQEGIGLRIGAQATGVAQEAQVQFALAVQNLEARQCVWARQRLEYVVGLDPNFPGVTDKLADALYCLSSTATPTPAPTPTAITLTATPDRRPVEALFTQGQQFLAARDWSNVIDTLLKLRLKDPESNGVQVDGMFYVALRNRGVEKISKQADLEGGIYDLTLAERFGPLDLDALGWREWSKWYIRGASFWEVDWAKSISYFSQVAPIAPNLRDASGWTAAERYRIALTRYGDQLLGAGDYCGAQQQYEAALALLPNPTLEPTATAVADQCSSGASVEATPTPGGEITPSPEGDLTPTEETPPPTEIPTEEPTETPTEIPTPTPYP